MNKELLAPDCLYSASFAECAIPDGVKVPDRETTFCPIGINSETDIFFKQSPEVLNKTKFGRAPQLTPRSLTRIGITWKNN